MPSIDGCVFDIAVQVFHPLLTSQLFRMFLYLARCINYELLVKVAIGFVNLTARQRTVTPLSPLQVEGSHDTHKSCIMPRSK